MRTLLYNETLGRIPLHCIVDRIVLINKCISLFFFIRVPRCQARWHDLGPLGAGASPCVGCHVFSHFGPLQCDNSQYLELRWK